ncbi:MAG: hypothetical protein MZW92_38450 [Comamonadaceae bacterium]|nr:hypothetical protein [Comamonadaceae bacterium]
MFYGDATRLDLLDALPAPARRSLLVNAIDDVEDSLAADRPGARRTSRACRSSRGRATSRHYVELRTRGVTVVERETFEAALRIGRHALEALGARSLPRARDRRHLSAPQRHDASMPSSRISTTKCACCRSPRPGARNWRNCSRATAPGSRRTSAAGGIEALSRG